MILSLPGVKPKTETSFLQWGRSEAAQREAFQELQPASSTIYHHGFFPKLPDRGLQLSNRLDPSLFCDQSCSISCSSPCNWFFFGPFHLQNVYVLDILPPPDLTILLPLGLKYTISLFLCLGEFPSFIFKLQKGRTWLFKTETFCWYPWLSGCWLTS